MPIGALEDQWCVQLDRGDGPPANHPFHKDLAVVLHKCVTYGKVLLRGVRAEANVIQFMWRNINAARAKEEHGGVEEACGVTNHSRGSVVLHCVRWHDAAESSSSSSAVAAVPGVKGTCTHPEALIWTWVRVFGPGHGRQMTTRTELN